MLPNVHSFVHVYCQKTRFFNHTIVTISWNVNFMNKSFRDLEINSFCFIIILNNLNKISFLQINITIRYIQPSTLLITYNLNIVKSNNIGNRCYL